MGYNLEGEQKEDVELPLFDFTTISKATSHFSVHNKLGEGGFGLVYKVRLHAFSVPVTTIFVALALNSTRILLGQNW